MKALFVHDHKFKSVGDCYYSNGSFPSSIWLRYLKAFDHLTVVGRNGGVLKESESNYTLSSEELVDFSLLPNISNFKSLLLGNRYISLKCKQLVSDHNAVIARLPSRLGYVFIDEAIKQGKPYAVEVVGCSWDALWNYGDMKGKIAAPFFYCKTRQAVANAPYVLYVTKKFLQERYPCRKGETTFCSNVEISRVKEEVLMQRKAESGSTKKKLIFGLIGNYSSKYKGIDIAIRALALVNNKFPNWELQVLGAGDCAEYSGLATDLGIDSKVKFIGSLPSGDPVYNWLDTLDIYLQPSHTEGLPRALIEAMSRGCPALGSNVGGISELLQTAQMIKPGDYKLLSEKIFQLLQDPSLIEKLSNDNFNKAKSYYKDILEKRRTEFLLSFKQYVLAKG